MVATPPGQTISTMHCEPSSPTSTTATTPSSVSVGQLAKAFHRPHVHDGNYSEVRQRRFGAPAEDIPPRRFVVFCQDHDQVGNRAFGDRLPAEARPLAAFCVLLSPFTPMLFMGEEYGENAPFQFFSDHIDKRIADATRKGRRAEFAAFAVVRRSRSRIRRTSPTFEASKLTREVDPELAALYAELLRARRELPSRAGRRDRLRRAASAGCACGAAPSSWSATSATASSRCALQGAQREAGHAAGGHAATRPAHPARAERRAARDPRRGHDRGLARDARSRSGATWDGNGTNFSLFSEHAEAVELCLFDEDGDRDAGPGHPAARAELALLPARRRARPALRLPRPRPVRARERAPLQPGKAADRPVRQGDRGRGRLQQRRATCCRTCPTSGGDDDDFELDDEDDAAVDPQVGRGRSRLRLGGRPAAADPVRRHGHLRDPRPRLHDDAPGRSRGPARHLRRARLGAGARVPQGPGRDRRRAAADPSHLRRVVPGRARAVELLGLQHDRLPGAALRVRGHRPRVASRCASSRAWSRRCTAPASR